MPKTVVTFCTASLALKRVGGRCLCLLALGLVSLLPTALSAEQKAATVKQFATPEISALERFGLDHLGLEHLSLDQWGRFWEIMAHERLLATISDPKAALAPFTTDGCSGGFSSSWEAVAGYWPGFASRYQHQPPFENCCITHDRAYHDITGAFDATHSYAARLRADRDLRQCVWQTGQEHRTELAARYGISEQMVETGFGQMGWAIYYAVRFGGQPCSGLSWRWGYGYPDC